MYRLILIAFAFSLSPNTNSAEVIATTPEYNAVAFFTSGIFNDDPIDVIEKANLNQDRIVLYVRWSNLQLRSYHTRVRILDPSGGLIRELDYAFEPTNSIHHSHYWYQPKEGDPTGDWTWEIHVDGEKGFYALIPVTASQ